MATLAAIRTTVRYRLGLRDDLLSGDGLTAINEWINEAYREIAHTFRFSELETEDSSMITNATDRFTTLPTRTYAVFSIFDVTNSKLLDTYSGGWHEYERETSQTIRARPSKWLRFADRIYYKDPPDGAYTMRAGLWLEPVPLVGDGESPVIPEIWHDGIKILATRNGWRGLGDDRRAELSERGEWPAFLQRVRLPMGIEANNPRRRGLRVKRYLSKPTLGM